MEGLLDHLLRDTLTQAGRMAATGSGGIDACVTEFIRITSALLPADRFYRVVPELRHRGRTPSGVPVRVQFLGSDPACMAENAARVATLGALGIDLNFGCPTKLVNRHGGGAALLKDPELMRTHRPCCAPGRARCDTCHGENAPGLRHTGPSRWNAPRRWPMAAPPRSWCTPGPGQTVTGRRPTGSGSPGFANTWVFP